MNTPLLSELDDFYFSNAKNATKNKSMQHYHALYEIYYLKSGRCSYFIDDRCYEVEAGDIVFIPNEVIHKTNYPKEQHSRLLINCSADYLPPSIIEKVKNMPRIFRNKKISAEAERLFLKIGEEYNRRDEMAKDAIKCYTGELFFLLLRNIDTNENATRDDSAVTCAGKYIRENYTSQISISEIAEMLSVSLEHLSRAFKKETGFGLCEYLNLLRLQKAEYMLKNEPGMSISEIAYACGFNDSNYFSDKFKKNYGISPSQLKKRE